MSDNQSADTNLSPFSLKAKLVYFVGFLNFAGFAFTIIAIVAKINLYTNNDANTTSATSSQTYFTVYLLQNLTQLLTSKYNSALSVYIGRKPMLIVSAFAFALSRVAFAASTSIAAFYIAAVISG